MSCSRFTPCVFFPGGCELQTAKSGSARLMLRVLLLILYPEEREPPEQFIFSPLAVFQFFTFLLCQQSCSQILPTLRCGLYSAVMSAQVIGVRVRD